ncbi:MAG: hypothetical protein RL071_3403 [Pseudomonadota bacterium]
MHLPQRLHLPLLAALLAPAACAPREDKADPRAEAEDSAAPAADGAEPGPDCAAAPLDCDGVNNDCDGQTDEGAEVEGRILSGVDRDGDGWSVEAPTLACPPVGIPAAPLAGGGDCDDRDAARSPGNTEDCLGAGDEDCDGLSDCADPECGGLPCAEDCADGVDNELDGLTDCADTVDCASTSACAEGCDDGVDNDLDGLTDCADTEDCASTRACAEDCADGVDNDFDGLTDCADLTACRRDAACAEDCADGVDNDFNGLTDCADLTPCLRAAACAEDCADGVDNNGDGAVDCADPRCASAACPELCGDGVDNDAEGLIDCRDPDCWGSGCWENCALDGDEDGDGLADCEDAQCITDCTERCDGVDRDRDGLIDCRDPDCWGSGCGEDCALDGDEDGDGLADCEDAHCITDCTERCDGVDRDRDGLVGCDDPDCGLMIECWTELRGGAEGLRLSLSQRDNPRFNWAADAALLADALWLSGVAHTASGAPIDCAVSLHGLRARNDLWSRGATEYSRGGGESSSTAAFSADPPLHPDCPFVGPGDVTVDALHWASYPSDWALLPGDVHQMLRLRQAAPTGTRLGWISLYVTAQTGSTVGTSPSGRLSEAQQVLFGTPTFEPAP